MANIEQNKLKELMDLCKDSEGDTMEIGVLHGRTFKMIVPFSHEIGKKAFALDSFCGMDNPGEFDGDQYPKGRLNNGGVQKFKNNLRNAGIQESLYECFEGYIPVCFEKFDKAYPDKKLSFALLDVDHYEPTVIALEWIWNKLSSGGVLVLDDYFPGRGVLAGKAIDEWLPTKENELEILDDKNTQLFVRKK